MVRKVIGMEVQPRVRQCFMKAFDKLDEQYRLKEKLTDKQYDDLVAGHGLTDLIVAALEEDVMRALATLQKFMPREVNVHGTHEHVHQFATQSVPRLVDFIEGACREVEVLEGRGDGAGSDAEGAGEVRPVLPDSLPDESPGHAPRVATGKVSGGSE